MDWHRRFVQQASWTRDLRAHLLGRAGFYTARRVLEVGSGTGAILQSLISHPANPVGGGATIFGLDISTESLMASRTHAPSAVLVRADAHAIPCDLASFDITFCHFLLLWVSHPARVLKEMRRVTRPGGHVIAFAEPDYTARLDSPAPLKRLGLLQAKALRDQGADVSMGARLATLFEEVGLRILEAGSLEHRRVALFDEVEFASEWEVLKEDLAGILSVSEIDQLMCLDSESRRQGTRILHVPTYFTLGRV